jgi:hypothetical protein
MTIDDFEIWESVYFWQKQFFIFKKVNNEVIFPLTIIYIDYTFNSVAFCTNGK